MNVPAANAVTPVAQLSTLQFTSPLAGTAILRGRGYCNMATSATEINEVDIAAGTVLANVFNAGVVGEWGAMRIPAVAVGSTSYAMNWTSETTLAVNANVPTTVFLGVRHASGANTVGADCSGSFTVQVYGALP